ncbi:MAG: hypothetical protein HKO13_04385 [Sphingomonas sp.]|nr:hypothetical protein [Sphingomonas sp.]
MDTYNVSGNDRNHSRAVKVPRETIAHLIDDLVGLLLVEEPQEREEVIND